MAIAEATAETPGKQINFEPINTNLIARMRSLQTLTTTGRSTDKNGVFIEPSRAKLDDTLSLSIYQFATGGTILTTQDNFLKRGINSEDLGNPLRSQYQRFSEDLSYVSLLEFAGLKGVNERIQLLINGLRNTTDDQIIDRSTRYLNDIMGRAIHLFPHVAKGIEVSIPAGRRNPDFTRVYGEVRGRKEFTKLDLYNFALHNSHLEALVVPLPYLPTTENISTCFTFIDEAETVPGLAVRIGNEATACFTLDEVKSVKFDDTADSKFVFSPSLETDFGKTAGQDKIISRPNWIKHYLNFRGFGSAHYRYTNDFAVDKAELYYQSLLVPEDNSELIKMRKSNWWSLNGDSIEQAFIALDLYPHMVMYEVRGAFPWDKSIRQNAPYLLDRILSDSPSHERGKVQRYVGEDIISRLAAIPKGL